MTCLVDAAHPTLADDADDLVGLADELADERVVGFGLGDERRRIARAHEEVGGVELVARRAAARERPRRHLRLVLERLLANWDPRGRAWAGLPGVPRASHRGTRT